MSVKPEGQESAATLEQAVFAAMLVSFAGAVFQTVFQTGGYVVPTDEQHHLMVKSISDRVALLALGDTDPEAARLDITEHVHRVVAIVLGPSPRASSLN